MKILVGIIGFPLGLILVVYRERVKRFTGDLGFAEKWFGPGGTYTFLLIFGIAVSFLSILYAFGTLQLLLAKILGPLFLSVNAKSTGVNVVSEIALTSYFI